MDTQLTQQLIRSRQASYQLGQLTTAQKNAILRDLATALINSRLSILRANQSDFKRLPSNYNLVDRLLLTDDRITDMATSVRAVTKLTDPVGTVLRTEQRPSGLTVKQIRVPIGVVGVIYEARPNVTVEIFSLALKTGNAVVLKGGRDADETNQALIRVIQRVLKSHKVSPHAIQRIDPFKRQLTQQLLRADGYVDIVIPRGSDRLIQFVRQTATVPVIETGAGVCHTYVERSADLSMAANIITNAKVRRCTVCNALDCVVVDATIVNGLMKKCAPLLAKHKVRIFADPASYRALKAAHYPDALLSKSKPQHYGKEFLSLRMSIKTVSSFESALQFVQSHTSKHSEAIITKNKKRAELFTQLIDAAAVYVNTSTAFTDGFEFGLGAEVGISTQKLHARGPMGLEALTTYKWVVHSAGKTRS